MNHTRWDGQRRGFYEAYFLLANDCESGRAVWMRWLLSVPKRGRGTPTITRWCMLSSAGGTPSVLRTVIARGSGVTLEFWRGLCDTLRSGKIRGASEDGTHYALEWQAAVAPVALYPSPWMYHAPWPKTKVCTPCDQLSLSGHVSVGSKRMQLRGHPGMLGHLWGTQMAESWAWLQCNTFDQVPDARCEFLSANIKAGPVHVPTLTLARVHLGERSFMFNRPAYWRAENSAWDCSGWSLELSSATHRLFARVVAPLDSTIGVTYAAPDGSRRYCYHNDFAHVLCEISERTSSGWREIADLHASQSARFESVARTPLPRLPLHL